MPFAAVTKRGSTNDVACLITPISHNIKTTNNMCRHTIKTRSGQTTSTWILGPRVLHKNIVLFSSAVSGLNVEADWCIHLSDCTNNIIYTVSHLDSNLLQCSDLMWKVKRLPTGSQWLCDISWQWYTAALKAACRQSWMLANRQTPAASNAAVHCHPYTYRIPLFLASLVLPFTISTN